MEIVAIIASTVVALAAIGSTWHQHIAGLKHSREIEDLRAVRDLLDESIVALLAAAYSLDDVRSQLTQHGGSAFFKSDAGTKLYETLGSAGRVLDELLERLRIRLGPTREAVRAYTDADDAVLHIYRAAGLLRLEPEAEGDQSAVEQIRNLNDQKRTEIEEARNDFDRARETFTEHANQLAGARLGE